MTSCECSNYLIYAFCSIEGNAMSTVTLHMASKRGERRIKKSLKPLYVKVTALKLFFNEYKEL